MRRGSIASLVGIGIVAGGVAAALFILKGQGEALPALALGATIGTFAMARFGPKLEREQVLLGRFVEIGTELYAIATTCSRAQSLLGRGSKEENAALLELVDYFCCSSRLRIERAFHGLRHNADRRGYRVAQQVLRDGNKSILGDGIVHNDY